MPNIIVREYDNTKAGVGQYSNFAVLIAGPAKSGATCFDDNGVYEVSSQKDFEEKVGLLGPQEYSIHGVQACVPEDTDITFEDDPEPEQGEEPGKTAEEKFNELVAGLEADEGLYIQRENSTHEIGYFKTIDYKFDTEKITTWDESYDEGAVSFGVIKDTKVGRDGAKADSYGNLMAYILLGLGYTVLYKKVTTDSDYEKDSFWEPLKDKSEYDFRYITHGLLGDSDTGAVAGVNEAIIKLAHFKNDFDTKGNGETGRGDCVALCEIDAAAYKGKQQATAIADVIEGLRLESSSKYAAYFAPYVVYAIDANRAPWNKFIIADKYIGKFPAVFHYLACASKAAEQFNEWYAVAGYNRGVSDFVIDHAGCTFGEIAVKALQARYKKDSNSAPFAVNLITKIKGSYYLWGNRTAFELGDKDKDNGDLRASHFLNIRQLCTTIKKQIYITCRKYTYDPNSDILWANFCNDIRPTLEKMKADQGITDYKFIKVKTNKKALLKAKIRIVPIEAVEDFDISLTLEDSISGIVAGVGEEDAE